MSYAMDPAAELARQVVQALEDEFAQPLEEVQDRAPEDCHYFSELEASLGEWSFGYGIAWALVRQGDPMLSSRAVNEIARRATAIAWRQFSEQSWDRLMAEDRARRGPVGGEQEDTGEWPPANDAPPAPTGDTSEEDSPATALTDFMGKVAKTRPNRPERRG